MTELQPVSFRKPRGNAPRLSSPRKPGRHSSRFWSEAEDELVRKHYQSKGAAWLLQHLPGRQLGAIYQRAAFLGLKLKERANGGKRWRDVLDIPALEERIKAAWPDLAGKGAVSALADELKIPRRVLYQIATRLGLVMPHKKEPPWSPAEDELLTRIPLHNPELAARTFREHGYQRSPTAIVVRCKRLGLSRRYDLTYSATAAAKILGIDNKSVTALIFEGLIKANRRDSLRLPQQGGAPHSIERAELRRFIIEHLERIDFRKVDKFAIVDLLTRETDSAAD